MTNLTFYLLNFEYSLQNSSSQSWSGYATNVLGQLCWYQLQMQFQLYKGPFTNYVSNWRGGGDVRKILTLAERGGRGGLENADINWQKGEGGLANADNHDKNA